MLKNTNDWLATVGEKRPRNEWETTAHFLFRPRRTSELAVPHLPADEHRFSIVAEVILDSIDYENFSEDLLADRDYLERYRGPISINGVYQCLLIRRRTHSGGILVAPKDGFVFHAALYPIRTKT